MPKFHRFGLVAFLITLPLLAPAQMPFVVAYNETTAPLVPLFRAVYAEMGMAPTFELVSSERAITLTNEGAYDADLSRVPDSLKGYSNLVPTKEPIRTTEIYAYARKGAKIVLPNKESLRNFSVGLIRGSKFIEDFVKKESLDAFPANTAESFYSMLNAGRFEIGLVTSTQLLSQSAQLVGSERVGPALASSQSFHILNKKHADLIPRIDVVLKAMRADGRLAKLLKTNP